MIRTLCAFNAAILLFSAIIYAIALSYSISIKNKKHSIFTSIITALSSIMAYIYFMTIRVIDKKRELNSLLKFFENKNVGITILLLSVILLAINIFVFIFKSNKLTKAEIYYGINKLDLGICYYKDNGITVMVNEKMDKLAYSITNSFLFNGNEFYNILEEKMNNDHEFTLNDRIYNVIKNDIDLEGNKVNELIIIDITNKINLRKNLEESQRQKLEYQMKLKNYSNEMNQLIKDEEILDAKINYHAQFGNLLLLGRYSLTHLEQQEEFKNRIKKLSIYDNENNKEEINELINIAKLIGIDIIINGTIKNDHIKPISRLLNEAITNCYKHAFGSEITLNVITKENVVIYECFNNGIKPDDSFHEGGGLQAIRLITEKNNGIFSYSIKDKFIIKLEFKGEQ